MGLTIHYSGKLRNPASIPSLIEEAIDISESMHWPYEIIEPIPNVPIQGVLISPEGSEPLWLTFHEAGFMCNPILYNYVLEVEGKSIPADAEQWLFTKTQYAGVEVHMALIRLLRYLSQQYFERFELHDESQYWETNDESICRKRFGEYDRLMNMVGDALDNMEIDPTASKESIVEKIEKMLTEKFGLQRKA
jgi:hypothetical protein